MINPSYMSVNSGDFLSALVDPNPKLEKSTSSIHQSIKNKRGPLINSLIRPSIDPFFPLSTIFQTSSSPATGNMFTPASSGPTRGPCPPWACPENLQMECTSHPKADTQHETLGLIFGAWFPFLDQSQQRSDCLMVLQMNLLDDPVVWGAFRGILPSPICPNFGVLNDIYDEKSCGVGRTCTRIVDFHGERQPIRKVEA